MKSSILSNAASFICLHNHPSGDTAPSKEDLEVTKRLIAAGDILDIRCLDHVIIGGGTGEVYSFREHGRLEEIRNRKQDRSVSER